LKGTFDFGNEGRVNLTIKDIKILKHGMGLETVNSSLFAIPPVFSPMVVSFPLKRSVSLLVIRMGGPVSPPVLRVLLSPSLLGVILIETVVGMRGKFALPPPILPSAKGCKA